MPFLSNFRNYVITHPRILLLLPDHQSVKMKRQLRLPLSTVTPIDNLIKSSVIHTETNCFYANIAPIFKLASCIGLNITESKHGNEKEPIVENSEILTSDHHITVQKGVNLSHSHSSHFLSFPSFTNLCFSIIYSYCTIWLYLHLGEHLGIFFQGVDFYTLAIDVVSNFGVATYLLLHSRLQGNVLLKAIREIQQIYVYLIKEQIGFELPKYLRVLSFSLVIYIVISTIIYGCLFIYLIFFISLSGLSKRERENLYTVSFVLEKICHFLLPLYTQTFVALFIVCAEVIRQLFINLAFKLKLILTPPSPSCEQEEHPQSNLYENPRNAKRGNSRKLSEEIEACRLLYNKLNATVGTISQYFGGSLLTVSCIAVVSLTAGIYTIILFKVDPHEKTPQTHKDIITFYFFLWGFHFFFSFYNLCGILISGQRITNAVLNNF